jgi:F-type H+-transporting ATPase subunit a
MDVPFPPGVEDFDFDSLIPGLRGADLGLAFTKITFMVWLAVAIVILFFLLSYRRPKIVPSRAQWLAESVYGFVRDGIAAPVIGSQGVRFAPYLTALFCFIAVTNVFAIVPLFQVSPNAHIAFPAVLAIITYVQFIYLGIRKHGVVRYFRTNLFMPGIPWPLYFLLTPIEIIQTFFFRPVTLAVRLFANMFAGHLMLLVFTLGGFAMLTSANLFVALLSPLSFAFAIVMTFFEFGVVILQAYVFTMLTASYIEGAIADSH